MAQTTVAYPPAMPDQAELRVSIVVIGDEILSGYVQDTNSGWIAQRLQALGIPLDRIVTVPDEVEAIGEALQSELDRARPRLVLTSGGIGSTPDDCTIVAVADHMGIGLVRDDDIDRRISRALSWTISQGVAVTPAQEQSMRKMAYIPDGSYLLPGARGMTPGIAFDVEGGLEEPAGATIVILPGIPSEMRRIMIDGIEPTLLVGKGTPPHVVELTHAYPESLVNPVLDRLAEEFPDVHVGSYPGRECLVRLKGIPERVTEAEQIVREFLDELSAQPASETLREAWRSRWDERETAGS